MAMLGAQQGKADVIPAPQSVVTDVTSAHASVTGPSPPNDADSRAALPSGPASVQAPQRSGAASADLSQPSTDADVTSAPAGPSPPNDADDRAALPSGPASVQAPQRPGAASAGASQPSISADVTSTTQAEKDRLERVLEETSRRRCAITPSVPSGPTSISLRQGPRPAAHRQHQPRLSCRPALLLGHAAFRTRQCAALLLDPCRCTRPLT